jgi:hypothetical protein
MRAVIINCKRINNHIAMPLTPMFAPAGVKYYRAGI